MKILSSRQVPTSSFASVMGIAGLGLAWRAAANGSDVSPAIGEWLIALSAIVFLALLVVWLARIGRYPNEVSADNNSAITASYCGTLTISCSLLASGAVPYSPPLAFVLWVLAAFGGAALQGALFRDPCGTTVAGSLGRALFCGDVGMDISDGSPCRRLRARRSNHSVTLL